MRRAPVLTAIALGLSAIFTLTRAWSDGVEHALWRDPGAIGRGQVWRLITPVLVQSDRSVVVVVCVFALCAAVGTLGEQVLSRPRWIACYLAGALAGHGIGEWFQPHGGGTSVAFMGVLGGLAAAAVLAGAARPQLWRWRFHAMAGIVLAVVDTVLRDIHGVAFLAGLAVATGLAARARSREAAVAPAGAPDATPGLAPADPSPSAARRGKLSARVSR